MSLCRDYELYIFERELERVFMRRLEMTKPIPCISVENNLRLLENTKGTVGYTILTARIKYLRAKIQTLKGYI